MPRIADPDALRVHALELLTQMQQFHIAQPHAIFTEIEEAIDAALAGLRHDLLE